MSQRIIRSKEKLSDRSVEVAIEPNIEQVKEIADELTEIIKKKNLLCLTASQIGYKCRIFGINFNGDIKIFCNPMLCKLDGLEMVKVQNPSLPNKTYLVPRHKEIDIAYQTIEGKAERNKFESPVASVFESCIEIMDGVLPCDYGLEIEDDFNDLTEEEQQEVVNEYLRLYLKLEQSLNEDIENDDKARELRDGIRFWEKVQSGDIKLENQNQSQSIKLNRKQRREIARKSKKYMIAGKLIN